MGWGVGDKNVSLTFTPIMHSLTWTPARLYGVIDHGGSTGMGDLSVTAQLGGVLRGDVQFL